ncbi:MAG: ZIP family metal transporter [Candidatus Doudnabacteria bacterium]|nr:ZIP family metal transporter [Candidatus Doudnabacteria bacterium]
MNIIWIYVMLAVLVVSLISFVGVFTLAIKEDRLKKWLLSLVSFSAGALLGDVFIHILPEMAEGGWPEYAGYYLLFGILTFFILEKFVFWHHSHSEHDESVHSYTYLSLVSDGLHNLIDGMIIAGAFLVSPALGLATTLAVVFHEIPQEIGNFAVLVHGGFSRTKALFYNFVSALTAFLGAILVLVFMSGFEGAPSFLLSFSAASFIYIAMSDLIPQLHKEQNKKTAAWHLLWFVLGVFTMWCLILLE